MARAGTRKGRASLAGTKKSAATAKETTKVNGLENGNHLTEEEPKEAQEAMEVSSPEVTETKAKVPTKVKKVVEEEAPKARGRKRAAVEPDTQSQAKRARIAEEASTPTVSLTGPDFTGGKVLCVGAGDVGQLGLGEDVVEKTRVAQVPAIPDDIVAVSAGGLHTVCVDKSGEVHSWGCNDEGALGRITKCEEENFDAGKVEGITGKVVQVTAGDCHSAALTEDGKVFAWGTFRDNNGLLGFIEAGNLQKTPRELSVSSGEAVTMIASGNNHLALLGQSGRIYTCGCGESGQLGRLAEMFATRDSRNRNGIDALLLPTIVKVFNRRKAVEFDGVWAGGENTFARCKNTGHIHAWGLNNYNQLGDADTNTKYQPVLLKAIKDKKWKQFTAGQHHSLALSSEGTVYSMGRHDYGRLGLGSDTKKDAVTPTLIESIKEETVEFVSAAGCVSVLVTKSGKAYGFGMGTNNQLSQGDEDDCFEPTVLKGKQLVDKVVRGASVGGQHLVVVASTE